MSRDQSDHLVQQRHEGNVAWFSGCGAYRYDLRWLAHKGEDADTYECIFLMLNPSTADAFKLDPTNRRCFDFARRDKAKTMYVLNVFAFRATDPKNMKAHNDPIGSENDRYVQRGLQRAKADGSKLICAWGNHGAHLGRSDAIRQMIGDAGVRAWCFGYTKSGEPKHPLYLRKDAPLVPFE
ncbi:MAG: DUF1643 domain-containing protein [Pseudomonadota bacterium]